MLLLLPLFSKLVAAVWAAPGRAHMTRRDARDWSVVFMLSANLPHLLASLERFLPSIVGALLLGEVEPGYWDQGLDATVLGRRLERFAVDKA